MLLLLICMHTDQHKLFQMSTLQIDATLKEQEAKHKSKCVLVTCGPMHLRQHLHPTALRQNVDLARHYEQYIDLTKEFSQTQGDSSALGGRTGGESRQPEDQQLRFTHSPPSPQPSLSASSLPASSSSSSSSALESSCNRSSSFSSTELNQQLLIQQEQQQQQQQTTCYCYCCSCHYYGGQQVAEFGCRSAPASSVCLNQGCFYPATIGQQQHEQQVYCELQAPTVGEELQIGSSSGGVSLASARQVEEMLKCK